MQLLMFLGAGDYLMFDSFFTQEERQSIETIVWAARCRDAFLPTFAANPEYSHVRHETYWHSTGTHFTDHESIPEELARCSVSRYFALIRHRQFTGSSFLRHKLADVEAFGLPRSYVVVHASTPFNAAGTRAIRDLDGRDWSEALRLVEALDTVGVVLNSVGADPPPEHPRLLDLSGKTTMSEAIEILKTSNGYIGLDSFLSILAAQLLPPEALHVRCRNPYVVANSGLYFAPQREFAFLRPNLDAAPYAKAGTRYVSTGMRLIELNKPLLIGDRSYFLGDVADVEDDRAKTLVEQGHATYFVPPVPPMETAVLKQPRKRKAVLRPDA